MKRLLLIMCLALSGAANAQAPPPCYSSNFWVQCYPRNIRPGLPAAATGAITNPTTLENLAGFYRNNQSGARASATQTGYTQVFESRVTTSGGVAFGVYTNYQDAETRDAAMVTTNQKTGIEITGNGVLSVGTGLKLPTSGGTAGTLASYEELSLSLPFTGPRTVAVTAKVVMVGKAVTMTVPGSLGVACTVATGFTTATSVMPSRMVPGVTFQNVSVPIQDNSATPTTPGVVAVVTDGRVQILADANTGAFTAAGTCGWQAFSVSWTTN